MRRSSRFLARRQQAAAHFFNSPGGTADKINTNGIQVGTVFNIAGKVFRRNTLCQWLAVAK